MSKTADNKKTVPAGLGLDDIGDLSSLLDSQPIAALAPGKAFELDLDTIDPDPNQPRKVFDQDALQELAASIELRGVKTPISVRDNPEAPGRYIINHGERRWRGSRLAQKTSIPAIIDNDYLDDDQVIENIQREALTAIEIAEWIDRKLKDKVSKGEIAKRLGKSNAFVSQHVTLLSLPAPIAEAYDSGRVVDVTVVNELTKAYKGHPDDVERWMDDGMEITRGSVKMLREFLDEKDESANSNNAEQSSDDVPQPQEIKKTPAEPDPDKLKKAIVQVQHDERPARLILNKRPPAIGFAWLKYDDDGEEFEADLSKVTLIALVEG